MNPMYITFAIYLVAVLLIGLAAYFRLHPWWPPFRQFRDCDVCRCFRYVRLAFDGLARCHLPERFE